MRSSIVNTLAFLLFHSLLAVGTPTNPDESLRTRTATEDLVKSDPVNSVPNNPTCTLTENRYHTDLDNVTQVHILNERHKHNHEWEDEDVSDYGGNPYKRQVDDELLVVPEVKKEHHDGGVCVVHCNAADGLLIVC